MKLLVLGGTRFLGRHIVEAALGRGHEITVFTRGATPSPFGDAVTHVKGDRDPSIAPGLAALEGGHWDAAIDTSGYVPRCVRAAAISLASSVAHYTFVSSISVYADASRPGLDESAAVAALEDPASEDIKAHYGALKARCEEEIRAVLDKRACIVRPGLIVGPYDPTDRFAYWVARFCCPQSLGERGETAIVPAPRDRPIQLIDARDLAQWQLDLAETRVSGTFNAVSTPLQWTMGTLVDILARRSAAAGHPVIPKWVDERTLAEHGVIPWTELPLWIPGSDPESAGFMHAKSERAVARGLSFRPLETTVDDTTSWLAVRRDPNAWRGVLSDAKERALASS